MDSVDLFLEDEGQQYGNMEEAATVARTRATCLEVWSGDHRQTPGGLKKSKEAKAFRKKLTKRPLALRCQTQYIQAHDFGNIVMRYLDCPKESFAWKLRQLLTDGSAAIDPAVGQFWHEFIGDSPPRLSTEIQRAAYAILWMGLRGEREGIPSMLATSFAEAAGVWSPKMGTGALQQCAGLSGYTSNGSWSKIPRIGHLQWNSVEVWQVRPTGKTATRWFPPYFLGCSTC